MKRRLASVVLLIGLALVFVPTTAFAAASASATAKAGDDCGQISKKEGQNTGAMEVDQVTKNGLLLKEGVDYTVENNASTRPKINFTDGLAKDDKVEVGLTTGKHGSFKVNLTLSDC